ncbi:histidine--tRNA ligase, partial [Mesorhizobium sp. USDA-HM6]
GIKRGDYVIRVNNRKVLDGVLEAIGLGGDENAGRRLTVLRAIDKLDKLGPEGVRLLLGPGRWDGGKEGEGDFAKGAGLKDTQAEAVLLATARNGQGGQDNSVSSNAVYQEGVAELATIEALVRAAGYGEDRVAMD